MIVALLDDLLGGNQLSEFYRWMINDLGTRRRDQLTLAWTKVPVAAKRRRIIARIERLKAASSDRWVV
jgi:hypothetical protein